MYRQYNDICIGNYSHTYEIHGTNNSITGETKSDQTFSAFKTSA